MATADPLILLRQAIKEDKTPIPTTLSDAGADVDAGVPAPAAPEAPLSEATHLQFVHGPATVSLPLDTPTRFVANDKPFDLRSIYFGWLNRNIQVTDYHSSASELSQQLAAAGISSEGIRSLGFVERVELITWLESPNEESEFIKAVAGDAGAVGRAGTAAGAAAQKGSAAPSSNALRRSGRGALDPRLAAVYDGERRMGDRNSVLRGIKPTDFSHVRKLATQFVQKKPPPGPVGAASGPVAVGNMALSLNPKHARRVDPIILLSPSASSLLRMSNARSFLEGGTFVPPDSGAATANLLHVSRLLREVDPTRPMRFVLVEGTEQFKPEYWDRVVAVFTTGQAWQFKSYRWSTPLDLFKRIPGVYLGWRGDQPPELIRSWGQRVLPVAVDRWREAPAGADATRFRDKEAVEQIWRMVEINMLSRGWRRDSGPVPL